MTNLLTGKPGLAVAASILVLGALVWSRNILPKSRPTEASVRQVAGIVLETGEADVSPGEASIRARVENQTRRTAASVVFTVEAVDDEGRILAANPLGNVLDLQPGESRAVDIPLPASAAAEFPPAIKTQGRVDLVRWKD